MFPEIVGFPNIPKSGQVASEGQTTLAEFRTSSEDFFYLGLLG